MTDHRKIIEQIEACEDPDKLKTWIANARKKNALDVEEAAFRRLISLVPAEQPGTVEHEFWQMVNAFELTLAEERGKTVRLSRTRQKVSRVGEIQTLKDWALSDSETDGFRMLIERNMPEYLGEVIVLRHPDVFEEDVRAAARKRLIDAGVDVDRLLKQ